MSTPISNIPGSFTQLGLDQTRDVETSSRYHELFQKVDSNKAVGFEKFLKSTLKIFDTKSFFENMGRILKDNKLSDIEVYEALKGSIASTKKMFSDVYKICDLWVLQKGMGQQTAEHLKEFNPSGMKSYLEVSTRRYVNAIEKHAGLKFDTKQAVAPRDSIGLLARIEAGSLFSYPYQVTHPLNHKDCHNDRLQLDQTWEPLPDSVQGDIDLVSLLGGLHHTPEEKIGPFLDSLKSKMRPGAVILLREHDTSQQDAALYADVVHSVVNASDGYSSHENQQEIRSFRPSHEWQTLMEQHGFERINPDKNLILEDDPTANGTMAFRVRLTSADQVEPAAQRYIKNYQRSASGSASTWLEWGNVRYAKQYAEFIQTHHAYQFDYIGHLRQHWAHFSQFITHAWNNPEVNKRELIFSDNMAMNLTILLGMTVQLAASALVNAPSKALDYFRGTTVVNLSSLEKFQAHLEKDYSEFIDYDPFFKYPYFSKIKEMWSAVFSEKQDVMTFLSDVIGASTATLSMSAQGLLSLFINYLYYSPTESSDMEKIHVLINDPDNQLTEVINAWNDWKMSVKFKDKHPYERCVIEEVYFCDGKKVVSVPFYKSFMEFAKVLGNYPGIELLKVGGQDKITLDLFYEEDNSYFESNLPNRRIYTLPKLQGNEGEHYVTYEVDVKDLPGLTKTCKESSIHIPYVHVHR